MNVEACKLLSRKLRLFNFPYTTPVLHFPYIPVVPCDHAYKYVLRTARARAEGSFDYFSDVVLDVATW